MQLHIAENRHPRIGMRLAAAAFGFVQVGAAARAEPAAILVAEWPGGQSQQRLLANQRLEADLLAAVKAQPQFAGVELFVLGRRRIGREDEIEFLLEPKRIAFQAAAAMSLDLRLDAAVKEEIRARPIVKEVHAQRVGKTKIPAFAAVKPVQLLRSFGKIELFRSLCDLGNQELHGPTYVYSDCAPNVKLKMAVLWRKAREILRTSRDFASSGGKRIERENAPEDGEELLVRRGLKHRRNIVPSDGADEHPVGAGRRDRDREPHRVLTRLRPAHRAAGEVGASDDEVEVLQRGDRRAQRTALVGRHEDPAAPLGELRRTLRRLREITQVGRASGEGQDEREASGGAPAIIHALRRRRPWRAWRKTPCTARDRSQAPTWSTCRRAPTRRAAASHAAPRRGAPRRDARGRGRAALGPC